MILKLYRGCVAAFSQMSKPLVCVDGEVEGVLYIGQYAYRIPPSGANICVPSDGIFPMSFVADSGERYAVKLAKIRGGRIVPAVCEGDIVELFTMIKSLEKRVDDTQEDVADTIAKVDTDVLGSLFRKD